MQQPIIRRGVVAVALTLLVAVGSQVAGPPAMALTPDERFVTRIYQDFVLRDPTDAELLWITTLLANGTSRASVVNGHLASPEFGEIAAYGAYYLYLGRSPTDPELASSSALITGNDYYGLEVSLLAGADYFTNAGGTNQLFVTALYNSVFNRAPDPSGLTYWTGQLNGGLKTRSQVAGSFIKTTEAANLRVGSLTSCSTTVIDDEISLYAGAYCIVLNRTVSSVDRTFWSGQLQASGNNLPTLLAALASSVEYYNLP